MSSRRKQFVPMPADQLGFLSHRQRPPPPSRDDILKAARAIIETVANTREMTQSDDFTTEDVLRHAPYLRAEATTLRLAFQLLQFENVLATGGGQSGRWCWFSLNEPSVEMNNYTSDSERAVLSSLLYGLRLLLQ